VARDRQLGPDDVRVVESGDALAAIMAGAH
jgi:hypothetical protein